MPIQVLMPALSPTMNEGNLVKWHKKEGEVIKAGQTLFEIETDKATMEVEAVDEGILGRILVHEGQENVKVNSLVALLLEEDEDQSALEIFENSHFSVHSQSTSLSTSTQACTTDAHAEAHLEIQKESKNERDLQKSSTRVFATPLARRIAEQNQIDLSILDGSGPRGRIIKADVENYKTSPIVQNPLKEQRSLAIDPSFTSLKVSNIRKVIAQRLSLSKQTVPHFYLTIDCHLDNLLDLRQKINNSLDKESKISVNDFVIKAIAVALIKVPEANVAWGDDHIKLFDWPDVSVAVASDTGLITPIVRAAHQKSLSEISFEMKDLIAKARAGKLKPHEFQGGTFSLSNLGMFGIKDFCAIINPPQGCILAIGAAQVQPIVKEGKIEIGTLMSCTLSVDHRVVDGAVGAKFLQKFKEVMENPIIALI